MRQPHHRPSGIHTRRAVGRLAEEASSVLRADRDEICSGLRIVVPLQTKGASIDRLRRALRHCSLRYYSCAADAAHIATHRLYCDALRFWRHCPMRPCKRHRRCLGEPTGCLMRGLPAVPQPQRLKAQQEVIAGGPRRIAPATHIEWYLRRTELATVVSWGFG
jgi:hypothetical protein